MNGLRAGLQAGRNDLVDDQVAFRCGSRPDGHGRIRHLDMQRILVGLGIDGDRLIPNRRAVLMMRQAISPRLAIRMRLNMLSLLDPAGGVAARTANVNAAVARSRWRGSMTRQVVARS